MKMDLRTTPWMALAALMTIVAAGEFYYVLRAGSALEEAEKNTLSAQTVTNRLAAEFGLTLGENLRLEAIVDFSGQYQIPADLAAMIFDAAVAAGISPELGFRLVDVESAFNCRAISHAGAIGCTQVLPSTAMELDPHSRLEDLFDPGYNLHLGFRYLEHLLGEYEGDVRLALLAYNRGPTRVNSLLAMGEDPANGYAHAVCEGDCIGE